MSQLFLTLLSRSLSAGWIVLAIVLVRFLLCRAPKTFHCALWILVALRLLCPFSLESALSLIPKAEPAIDAILVPHDPSPQPEHTVPLETTYIEPALPSQAQAIPAPSTASYEEPANTSTPEQQHSSYSYLDLCTTVWFFGVLSMLSWAVFSYVRIYRKVRPSLPIDKQVYLCDYIDTPFLLGILRPRIYLPSSLSAEDVPYVLAHEQTHIHRRDHWWKPFAFCLLSLYWFHPLLWLAYLLLCRDIELACDERVVRNISLQERKSYSQALLQCSLPRHTIAACPLAFGEVGIKQRIRSILHYKKPHLWILLISVLVACLLCVCFLTDPPSAKISEESLTESPLTQDLWATELLYSHNGDLIYEIPDCLTDPLSPASAPSGSFAGICNQTFSEFTLTQENFDALFAEDGFWFSSSAKKLRRNNVHSWCIQESPSAQQPSHDFCYLLQQSNGDIYLVSGYYWDSKRTGNSRIEYVLKLEPALSGNPLLDGETPFFYTRTIQSLQGTSLTCVAYHADGSTKSYDLHTSDLLTLLHCIPPEAFSLGDPIQTVETSILLDLSHTSHRYDILLRYGDGKIEMVFQEDALWDYAKTGDQVWLIDYAPLLSYMVRSAQQDSSLAQLTSLQTPASWVQSCETSQFRSVFVHVNTPLYQDWGYTLGRGQIQSVLTQLQGLSDTSFVSVTSLPDAPTSEDSGAVVFTYPYPDETPLNSQREIWLYLRCGRLFFSFCDGTGRVLQTWEILDDSCLSALSSLLAPSHRATMRFAEEPVGTLSVSQDYACITLPQYSFLQYEVVEYTDDHTPFGIRLRPRTEDSGWLFLQFCPHGFSADPKWESTVGSRTERDLAYRSFFTESSDPSTPAQDWIADYYYNLPGDYAIVNEGADHWLYEFSTSLTYALLGLDFAPGDLTSTQILDIAQSSLQDTQSLANGSYSLSSSFDWKTGIWTIAAKRDESQNPTTVLQLDVEGNIR